MGFASYALTGYHKSYREEAAQIGNVSGVLSSLALLTFVAVQ